MTLRIARIALCILFTCVIPASAQTQVSPLVFTLQQDSVVTALAPGSTINMTASGFGRGTTAKVSISNRGRARIAIQQIDLIGSSEFRLRNQPITLVPTGSTVAFDIDYTPSIATRASALISVVYGEEQSTGQTGPQTVVTFQVQGAMSDITATYVSNGNILSVGSGVITFPGTVIDSATAIEITVVNRGSSTGTLNSVAVTGDAFQLAGVPLLPLSLNPGGETRFLLVYHPRQIQKDTGTLTIVAGGNPISAQIEGTGTEPQVLFSYTLPSTGNVVAVDPGGTIVFPPTVVTTSTSLTVTLQNRGTGPVSVNSISSDSGNFVLLGLPLLPLNLDSGKELKFGIRYQPGAVQNDAGKLTMDVSGRPVIVQLSASAIVSNFSYEMLATDITPFIPNQVLAIPDTELGQKTDVSIRVRNQGNADGQITSISVIGSGFQIGDLPVLPLTLLPNAATIFTLSFSPTQAGPITGRLRIGSDIFNLQATGIGVSLKYSYSNQLATSPLAPGGTVVFSPAAIGSATSLDFIIENAGTAAASIGSISMADSRSAFKLDGLPPLPVSIPPKNSLQFRVRFSPGTVGVVTDILRVDTQTFNFTGNGRTPPALPDYELTGPSGVVDALQQPAISLSLREPYPIDLSGALRLSVNSESFSADPAVQFATGGTTVNFTIPANTTRAIFANDSDQIRIQTGTVAGKIILTPSFNTSWGVNITPENIRGTTFIVEPSAPKLLAVQIGSKTSTSVSLVVTGFSTTRSARQMEFTFTPAPDRRLTNPQIILDVDSSSGLWYRSGASQGFGGLFSATVQFTIAGAQSASTMDALQSVSVSLSNEKGMSNSMSVDLR